MPRSPLSWSAPLLTLVALALLPSHAGDDVPTSPAPTAPIDAGFEERVTVQLAQINFIAVDRSGRPVLDLKAEEVEILDGREKQRVAFLQPYFQTAPGPRASDSAAGPAEPEPGVAAAAVAPGVEAVTEPETTARRWILLVFENFLTSSRTRLESIGAARSFVSEKIGPFDRVGVAAFDGKLQVLQNYTSDKTKILGAIDKAMQFTEHAAEDRAQAVKGLLDSMEHCAVEVDAASRPYCAQKVIDEYEATRIREADALVTAMVTLLRSSRAVSDPKVMILFTEGFPRNPGQDARDAAEATMGSELARYVTPRNRQAMDASIDRMVIAAGESKVSLFTINPGVGSRLTSISAASGRFQDNRNNVLQIDPYRSAELNAQHTLSDLAVRTGGVALRGADVRLELDRIDALSPAIYTVGYYPTLKGLLDDRREVKIRILRKGVRAEYRREANRIPEPSPLAGSLEVEPEACRSDGRRNVVVRLKLDRSSLTFSRQKKNVTANFSVYTRFVPAGRVVATFDDYRLFNITNTDEEHVSGELAHPSIDQRFVVPCSAMTVYLTASDGTSGATSEFTGSVGP